MVNVQAAITRSNLKISMHILLQMFVTFVTLTSTTTDAIALKFFADTIQLLRKLKTNILNLIRS